MLKRIETINFGKESKEQALTGLDLFIGSNGSGKSTIKKAIEFGLKGSINGSRNENEEIFKYASKASTTMGVKLFLDNSIIERTLNNNGSSITQGLTCSPLLEKGTIKQKNEAIIKNTIGTPLVLNFSDFISMKDGEKRKFIYSLLGESDNWNKEKVRQWIEKKITIKDTKLLSDLMKEYKDDYSIEEGIAALLSYIESKKKLLNAEVKKLSEGAKHLSDLKSKLTETTRNLQLYKEEETLLREQLIKVEKSLSANKQNIEMLEKINKDILIIQNKISSLEENIKSKNKDLIEEQLKEIKSINMEYHINKTISSLNSLKEKKNRLEISQEKIVFKGEKNKLEMLSMKELISKISEQNGICVLDKRVKCEKNFTSFINNLNEEVKNLIINDKNFREQYIEVREKIKEINREIDGLEKKKDDQNNTALKIKDEEHKLKLELKNISVAQEQSEIYKEHLEMLFESKEKFAIKNDTELLNKQKEALNIKINELKVKTEDAQKSKTSLIMLEKTLLERDKTEEELMLFKKIDLLVGPKGIQGEIVKSGLEPIREEIQIALEKLNLKEKFFFECKKKGKEVFNFGLMIEENKRYFETLSTGEQLLISVAMMSVIINKINSPTKFLIIDDIVHLDKLARNDFFNAMVTFKSTFDNIIMIGAIDDDTDEIPEEIKIWDMDISINNKKITFIA